VAANGRLPASALAPIPGGRLAKHAAASWNAMRAEIIRLGGPAIRPYGSESSYRTYAAQVHFKNLEQHGGNPAAEPGTSNHGLGDAVDVATHEMAAWIRRVGPRFGWSHAEGARVGEWWHFVYVGGYHPAGDPLAGFPADERRWIHEYDHLVATRRDVGRRRVLRRVMKQRRKDISQAAQKSGWNHLHRRDRYRSLYRRTT
jgi:hypothetical protein